MQPDAKGLTFVVVLSCGPLASAGFTYVDGTFDPADWFSSIAGQQGNSGTFTTPQKLSGGNPGEHVQVNHALANAPNGEQSGFSLLHERLGFTHDPAADGPIGEIDMSIDLRRDDQNQRVRFALTQGGLVYVSNESVTTGNFPTGWNTWAVPDLSETAFVRMEPDQNLIGTDHPDFSSTGAPITFGFSTGNNTGIGFPGYTTAVDYDNFALDIKPPAACPEDLDGSGAIDSGDLNILLAAFGASDGGDIDGDGETDSVDLNLLLAAFGDDCP